MLLEVRSATTFLKDLIHRKGHVAVEKLDKFSQSLEKQLCEKYRNHWHPEKPNLGSGFRCIRYFHTNLDPVLAHAVRESGMTAQDLNVCLPSDLTLWIDPDDVAYRIGEDGSICSLLDTCFLEEEVVSKANSMSSLSEGNVGLINNCKVESNAVQTYQTLSRKFQIQECLST